MHTVKEQARKCLHYRIFCCLQFQRDGKLGDRAVVLQEYLIMMLIFQTLLTILLILVSVLALGFILPVPFSCFFILALPLGFLATCTRNHIMALVFVLGGGVALFMQCLGEVLLILVIADVGAHCKLKEDCIYNNNEIEIPIMLVYVLMGLGIVTSVVVISLGIKSYPRFWEFRQEIIRQLKVGPRKKRSKGGADEEEGALKDDDLDY